MGSGEGFVHQVERQIRVMSKVALSESRAVLCTMFYFCRSYK